MVPAVHNNPNLTPPKIEGGFTVPNGIKGRQEVTVTYKAAVLSFKLANFVTTHLIVQK